MKKSESEKNLGPFSQSVQFIILSVYFLPSSLEHKTKRAEIPVCSLP